MTTVTIGIISEDPYDTNAVKNLLSQRYSYQFKPLLKRVRGSHLDSDKTLRLMKIELKNTGYPIVLFMRDLDGLETEKGKKKKLAQWFERLNKENKKKGILLINIYELEALILADIATFNRLFGAAVSFKGDPMYKVSPKEFLKSQTRKCKRKFDVAENPSVFKALKIERLMENCRYFKEFIREFDRIAGDIK